MKAPILINYILWSWKSLAAELWRRGGLLHHLSVTKVANKYFISDPFLAMLCIMYTILQQRDELITGLPHFSIEVWLTWKHICFTQFSFSHFIVKVHHVSNFGFILIQSIFVIRLLFIEWIILLSNAFNWKMYPWNQSLRNVLIRILLNRREGCPLRSLRVQSYVIDLHFIWSELMSGTAKQIFRKYGPKQHIHPVESAWLSHRCEFDWAPTRSLHDGGQAVYEWPSSKLAGSRENQ